MSDKDIPIDVTPVLPEDVNSGKAGTAPPSYEEVMGQHMTSVNRYQTGLPSLAYIDIMPMLLRPGNLKNRVPPKFQLLSEIVSDANKWLSNNPSFAVWKCETVERKVLEGQGLGSESLRVDLDAMTHRESPWGCNCFVFGIRLWLTQRPDDQKSIQEIGLINITPTPKEIKYTQFHSYGGLGFRHFIVNSRDRTFMTYEGLKKSVEDFNTRVKENPIPGSILNVETATLKFAEGFETKTAKDVAEVSSWHEVSGMTGRRLTQVLRLFYIKGPPTSPKIEFTEFLPGQLTQASLGRPIKFCDFTDVEQQAASWLKEQNGIKVLNIETREAKYTSFFNQGFQIDTDCTDDFDFPAFGTDYLKFIRVFYTSASGMPSYGHTTLSTRLFPPIRLKGPGKFESMVETMERIDAWLKITRVPIFGVETTAFLDEGAASFTKSQYSLRTFAGKQWITAVRLYFPTSYTEPAPELLPRLPKNAAHGNSSACVIL